MAIDPQQGSRPARVAVSQRWVELVGAIEKETSRLRRRPDVPDLLHHVLRDVGEMVPSVWAAAWLFDQEQESWVISASIGLTPGASALRLRSGALPCRVGESGVPLLINDLDKEEFHRTSEEHYRMRSALYAPMRIGAIPLGVLAVYSDQYNAYTRADLELLSEVGEHLGVAVAYAVMEERATQIAILEERDRQARDLHDGIHQVLSSLRIYALEARKAILADDSGEAVELLDELSSSIDEAAGELRESIATLRGHTQLFRDVYETAPRMRRRLEAAGVRTACALEQLVLAPSTSDAFAWICREATNNVLKHANARNVSLALRLDGSEIAFAIEDDGRGIAPNVALSESGLHIGLQVMHERAAAVGGTLTVARGSRGGTRIECRAPNSPTP
jgi:nitrate/nitrite-specific signal transduction histidine kinase